MAINPRQEQLQELAAITGSPEDGPLIMLNSDCYDEVIAVEYPSVKAFLALAMDPAILEAMTHRTAGLNQATIIRCAPGLGSA